MLSPEPSGKWSSDRSHSTLTTGSFAQQKRQLHDGHAGLDNVMMAKVYPLTQALSRLIMRP